MVSTTHSQSLVLPLHILLLPLSLPVSDLIPRSHQGMMGTSSRGCQSHLISDILQFALLLNDDQNLNEFAFNYDTDRQTDRHRQKDRRTHTHTGRHEFFTEGAVSVPFEEGCVMCKAFSLAHSSASRSSELFQGG